MNTVASAYVKSGRLCIMGLHECELGPVPFAYSVAVDEKTPEGKINVGDDKLAPEIKTAIEKSREPMLGVIEDQKMRIGAEQLVERARAGDQNAMAIIYKSGQAAKQGVARAKKACVLIQEYIDQHPADGSSNYPGKTAVRMLGEHVGEETAISAWTPAVPDLYVAALILANGPVLDKSRVEAIGSHFGDDDCRAFRYGFSNFRGETRGRDRDQQRACFAGQAVGLARTIQGVREGHYPISRLNPLAGAELGE